MVAWREALRESGIDLCAAEVEKLQSRHADLYAEQIRTIEALPGARELLAHLTRTGVPWIIATSGRSRDARREPVRDHDSALARWAHERSSKGYEPSMSNPTEEPSHDPTPEVEVGLEDPATDVLDQHRTAVESDEMEGQGAESSPLEADPADVADQRHGIPDDDERRGD